MSNKFTVVRTPWNTIEGSVWSYSRNDQGVWPVYSDCTRRGEQAFRGRTSQRTEKCVIKGLSCLKFGPKMSLFRLKSRHLEEFLLVWKKGRTWRYFMLKKTSRICLNPFPYDSSNDEVSDFLNLLNAINGVQGRCQPRFLLSCARLDKFLYLLVQFLT